MTPGTTTVVVLLSGMGGWISSFALAERLIRGNTDSTQPSNPSAETTFQRPFPLYFPLALGTAAGTLSIPVIKILAEIPNQSC